MTQNTRARSTRRKIQHIIFCFSVFYLLLFIFTTRIQHGHNIGKDNIIKLEKTTCIQHVSTKHTQQEIHTSQKIQHKVVILGASLEALRRSQY